MLTYAIACIDCYVEFDLQKSNIYIYILSYHLASSVHTILAFCYYAVSEIGAQWST